METSSVTRTELISGPLYFFDQPSKRSRVKGARSNMLAHEDAQIEYATQSNRERMNKESDERLPGETRGDGEPDTCAAGNTKDPDPMDAYRRAAPQLLHEVDLLLSQQMWSQDRIPHGIVNILNSSWKDLSAGAVRSTSPKQTEKEITKGSEKLDRPPSRQESSHNKKESAPRKPVRTSSTTFSLSANSFSIPGWMVHLEQPSSDELRQQISLCNWVLERLQTATSPQTLPEQDLTVILRHYGDTEVNLKDSRERRKTQPGALVNQMPQIPVVQKQDPERPKLHYRINDGSSFVYYPSGCIAVCQSHSALPCGGFYTNVFSDEERPVILATITASGHGAVTPPLSSAVTSVWDQDGGFTCDHNGNIRKEWTWRTGRTPRDSIVIQLSDVIAVTLLSGTSATLTFRCDNESVQLPLCAVSDINLSQEMTEGADSIEDHLLLRRTTSPAVVLENNRNLMQTPVPMSPRDVVQMVREVDELSVPWRRGGHAVRELRRLQQRVRRALDGWLHYYRVAIGIRCPHVKRMPGSPLRTRRRRGEQSAALSSLKPPERGEAAPVRPEEDRKEVHGHQTSAPAEKHLDVNLLRKQKKQPKEDPYVTQVGPLKILGGFNRESVIIIPDSSDLQPSAAACCPASPPSFPPSSPLTVCPALLRAALLGEERRRPCCCCSTTLMPAVTDLEYDAFVMGQPPRSHQILVVCVTRPLMPLQLVNAHPAESNQEVLEQLYRGRNKHRTSPCTQSLMDSFRLVRYEMSSSCGEKNILLQQRHNAAPGIILMYIRGKLLFVGRVFRGHSCSVRDLQEQISRTRRDYRSGLILPSDYKFCETVKTPAATDSHNSQDATLSRGDDATTASVEKNDTKNNPVPEESLQRQNDFSIKPKKIPSLPPVPVITH